ncbi:MAG TPA: hypothetical protein VN328_12225 [Thermodesulfovibrionales bacterium]|nr:hypothetical protein [Thermodesulfovibrionales bacterium]
MNKIIINVFMIALMAAAISSSYAFDNKVTHRDITKTAVLSSQASLDQILIDRLGFKNGIGTVINYTGIDSTKGTPFIPYSLKIIDLLREGSYDEDVPNCRASNHFHNPLKPWNQSGMSDAPNWLHIWCSAWVPWYSNIVWATGETPNTWDWRHTRNAYFLALTSLSEQDRNNYYAATFWGLGHELHLLQDVAVPAHVRNDFTGHWAIPNTILPYSPEKFEAFVKDRP